MNEIGSLLQALINPYYTGYIIKRTLFQKGVLRSRRLSEVPIICIGNLTVGGTGKSPFVAYVTEHLLQNGKKTVIISRGFKGKKNSCPTIVSDGNDLIDTDYKNVGDEPLMLARALPGTPVVIGRNRFSAAQLAYERFKPDVILLDDGFQHWALERDFDVVLFDATQPLSELRLLPSGRLREPLSAVARAHAVVITKTNFAEQAQRKKLENIIRANAKVTPIFHSELHIDGLRAIMCEEPLSPESVSGKKIIAFCGIANPSSFSSLIQCLGANIVSFHTYRDHYPFSRQDTQKIERSFRDNECDVIITTEKDAVRLNGIIDTALPYCYMKVSPTLYKNEEDAFWNMLSPVLSQRSSKK